MRVYKQWRRFQGVDDVIPLSVKVLALLGDKDSIKQQRGETAKGRA